MDYYSHFRASPAFDYISTIHHGIMEYVSQPGIVPDRIESRRYQVNIARACLRENTLVILPTGLGKTAVALMVAAEVLAKGRKVLMMAPTKPLVDQHRSFFGENLSDARVGEMNGLMSPAKRAEVMASCDFIVSTTPIDSPIPCIVVNAVLDEENYQMSSNAIAQVRKKNSTSNSTYEVISN